MTAARALCAAALLLSAAPATAQGYIGPSYLKVDGVDGGRRNERPYRGWVRAEASYWTAKPKRREIRGISGNFSGLKFTTSRAPEKGPDILSLAVDKKSPALAALMARCRAGAVLPRLVYAESSELARHVQERAPRPADIPRFYEFALSDVTLDCPVADAAPEQAFQLRFKAIEWLNSKPEAKPREVTAEPAKLAPVPLKGDRRTWVVSWLAPISDANEKQCATMNPKPTQADYFALMSPTRAAEQRAALADKGGATTVQLPYRGPGEMNVIMLPGIVPDAGFLAPKADVVDGFDLDGDGGRGTGHRNFVSPDGRRGIDNQLFTVQGCIAGWRRTGFLPSIGNELRRAGGLSILVEVSGIDDPVNDKDVAVTIYYSADPMRRDGTSKIVLADYTFRVNEKPEYSQDFARFRGRLVDGVVTTEPLDRIVVHEGSSSTWSLASARMRLVLKPDGTMTATLGGYRDWREYLASAFFQASDYENTIGFQAPAMYNAVRRAADGLRDRQTGEYDGISAAYEIIGVPAFIPPAQDEALLAGKYKAAPARLATAEAAPRRPDGGR